MRLKRVWKKSKASFAKTMAIVRDVLGRQKL